MSVLGKYWTKDGTQIELVIDPMYPDDVFIRIGRDGDTELYVSLKLDREEAERFARSVLYDLGIPQPQRPKS
jgi:hypothetical protein